jgi:hypothetical protein
MIISINNREIIIPLQRRKIMEKKTNNTPFVEYHVENEVEFIDAMEDIIYNHDYERNVPPVIVANGYEFEKAFEEKLETVFSNFYFTIQHGDKNKMLVCKKNS